MTNIINAQLPAPEGYKTDRSLFVHEGKFVDEPAEIINETQVDFNGDFCVPGFVDVQVYGAGG
ncbi:MAG: hypothetical protein ABIT96_00850, partial [Ferruginibacter sp.]